MGGFQKNEYFSGYEDFVDIFGDHQKIPRYLGVSSMHFKVFSLDQGTELGIGKISNIFWVLEISDIFGVNGRCWAGAYT